VWQYYLATVGTFVVALFSMTEIPSTWINLVRMAFGVAFAVLAMVGYLTLQQLIRLRGAWMESARAMNQIKDFYFQHAKDFEPEVLRSAFRWKPETLPPPDKPWTVFFYSATLIGFLDSMAYMAGGVLLDLDVTQSYPGSILGPLALFGLAFFAFHVWLYFAFLKPKQASEADHDVQSQDA